MKRIRIDATKATTPPNLLGIDRKIAYANKKYHSGLIWAGVDIGLAGIKLSGSPKRYGVCILKTIKKIKARIKPTRSLTEKYGWKGILSNLLLIPKGLFDPVSWRKIRCTKTKAAITNGSRKWRAKNRESVGFLTAKPPQSHSTIADPQ